MDLKKAKSLKKGMIVHCPPDRVIPGHTGTVEHIGADVYRNLQGADYIWITVKGPHHSSVWPSNRLG
jgi:hypothetical protein